MEAVYSKYEPREILQIIQANYRQQQQYDVIALTGQDLTFATTVEDWRDICDFVECAQLWKYLDVYFRLDQSWETWKPVLLPEDEKTLGDLCHFVSMHAKKDIILPIKLLGANCETAAIFRSLTSKLESRGIDTSNFRPSSELEPLVKKYHAVLIEEINLIDPTVLPPVNYKANRVYKWGLRTFITFLFVTIFLAYKESVWAWVTAGLSLVGFIVLAIGARMQPERASFAGIQTAADLVRKINLTAGRM